MLRLPLIALTLSLAGAARIARSNQNASASGSISHLYTWGAPHPSNPKITARNGGCFKGARFTNFDRDLFVDDEDIVPTLLVATKYNHPQIETIALADTKGAVRSKWSCGKNPWRFTNPKALLHLKGKYMSNMERLDNSYGLEKEASRVGLAISYESDVNAVRANSRKYGWNLVGVASVGEDVSYLVQQKSSLKCILTFEGSDSFSDWITDANIIRREFCGLPLKAHSGFRKELRIMVRSSSWQTNIRSKLGKCSSVDVIGHSLGGAVATLFAGCVDNPNGSEDYKSMSWRAETAALLSAV